MAATSYAMAVRGADSLDPTTSLTRSMGRLSLSERAPLRRIDKAHLDDVHGLIALTPEMFVSGSKDTTLKIWHVERPSPLLTLAAKVSRGYESWVTALAPFQLERWASGTRDGWITVWDREGNVLRDIRYRPKGDGPRPVSKQRNATRIHCIAEVDPDQTTFYVGTACYLHLCRGCDGKWLKSYPAHDNDWVYCIDVRENGDLIVVIGSDLEFWKIQPDASFERLSVIQETHQEHSHHQRPHISAITRLQLSPDLLATALFDGSIRTVDLCARKTLQEFHEHEGRVWSVVDLAPHTLASSADDATIKIWDTRQNASTLTLGDNPGRVSALLKMGETLLISASCPDRPDASEEKACLTFWDLRKIS